MSLEDIEADLPLLRRGQNYAEASKWNFDYNCLAFVLGDYENWWEPPGLYGHYWPPGFREDVSVETVTKIIKLHGFVVEHAPDIPPLTESIAVFAKGEDWEHFAKFANGVWSSKIGEDHDITHSSLQVLEGDLYGRVVKILSRNKV
jgi:hypothetical protein